MHPIRNGTTNDEKKRCPIFRTTQYKLIRGRSGGRLEKPSNSNS